jgi:RNA polymerase sigma-70 factor (ECF subfamily)
VTAGLTGRDDLAASVAADVFADGWGRITAAVIRLTGDWDLAEDCAQDAFAQALARWPADGVPAVPLAWLTTTARHRALDRVRRASAEAGKLRLLAQETRHLPSPEPESGGIPDSRLELMFTCAHPALATGAQVALTLRSLAGLSTAEIARAFLVSEHTMGQRLFRAKQKVRYAAIPFRVPPAHLLPERLPAVLHVLYLLFNEGYAASGGAALIRTRLLEEAIRLARVLGSLMPDEPEAAGLLALMLLQDSRRAARLDDAGGLVPLAEQDRSRWNPAQIAEGLELAEQALRRRRPGPFQIQAAIAACHASAPTAAQTDWKQIALLYEQLARHAPSPVVALNRAVAIAMAEGPEAGLLLASELAGPLSGYYLLPATRADLLRRAGRRAEAASAYRDALDLAPTDAEKRYLQRRLSELTPDQPAG